MPILRPATTVPRYRSTAASVGRGCPAARRGDRRPSRPARTPGQPGTSRLDGARSQTRDPCPRVPCGPRAASRRRARPRLPVTRPGIPGTAGDAYRWRRAEPIAGVAPARPHPRHRRRAPGRRRSQGRSGRSSGRRRSTCITTGTVSAPRTPPRSSATRRRAGEPGGRPARSCRQTREPGSTMTLPPRQPGDMHGRQLVTRHGMAASPGSRDLSPWLPARGAAGTTPAGSPAQRCRTPPCAPPGRRPPVPAPPAQAGNRTAPRGCPSHRIRPRGPRHMGACIPLPGPHPCYGPDSAAHTKGAVSPEKKLPLWEIKLVNMMSGIPSGLWSTTTASNTCLPANITPG